MRFNRGNVWSISIMLLSYRRWGVYDLIESLINSDDLKFVWLLTDLNKLHSDATWYKSNILPSPVAIMTDMRTSVRVVCSCFAGSHLHKLQWTIQWTQQMTTTHKWPFVIAARCNYTMVCVTSLKDVFHRSRWPMSTKRWNMVGPEHTWRVKGIFKFRKHRPIVNWSMSNNVNPRTICLLKYHRLNGAHPRWIRQVSISCRRKSFSDVLRWNFWTNSGCAVDFVLLLI